MSPATLKLLIAGVAVALILAMSAIWKVQDWRYGMKLAEQAGLHQSDLDKIGSVASAQVQAEQGKRLALEQRLAANDQTHHKELSDAQTNQTRLRDRLATADLRLSVLLAEDPASCNGVPATAGAVGMVHGRARAELDPAHAQRIIGITDDGDRGLIALKACQAYVREVNQR
ncbi:lysis system i-spanin subunit Rz [Pseudomonas hefeiensis]|uniref:Lysis system i-spanin subunit Rz n=1 Tax=Pseudomonas hefeiensis TaxID=2738125 RepID=A0ABY9G416_9PSED|nr:MULTISPECIES: lysis system i-spanin subunit Rz [unclassified Pseudomonas]WLH10297.1 lysis system i-spanin subunit Rz [Pseudomonas sp. FP205]WLI37663.1 lysis system i-spanin subunit Rz [Pseudomonas sp. FP821]